MTVRTTSLWPHGSASALEPDHDRREQEPVFVFRAASLWLAVPARNIVEVCEVSEPTPVPRAPSHVCGMIAYRGRALPLFDVGAFIGAFPCAQGASSSSPAAPSPMDTSGRIAVLEGAGMKVGLLLERALGIAMVARSDWKPPVSMRGSTLLQLQVAELELSVGAVALLNPDALLEAARMKD